MKLIALLAISFFFSACSDLPSDPGDAQQQQLPRSLYGPGDPRRSSPPALDQQPAREPVPGEVVPDR